MSPDKSVPNTKLLSISDTKEGPDHLQMTQLGPAEQKDASLFPDLTALPERVFQYV